MTLLNLIDCLGRCLEALGESYVHEEHCYVTCELGLREMPPTNIESLVQHLHSRRAMCSDGCVRCFLAA